MAIIRHPIALPIPVSEYRYPSLLWHFVPALGAYVGVPGVPALFERGVTVAAGPLYLVVAGGRNFCLGFDQDDHLLSVEVST